MAILAIDFDNTLTVGDTKWWDEEEDVPNVDMINWINEQYLTNTIIIHTARPWHTAERTVVWLKKNGVRFHGVMFDKMYADYYIDDKAVNTKDIKKWNQKNTN